MSFFRQFPTTEYDFLGNGVKNQIVDIFRYIKANDALLDDLSTYQYYHVSNGDRPDVVSNLIYKTPIYHWTFFLINDHLKTGLTGWPMSDDQFEEYMTDTYGGIVLCTRPVIIRDGDGLITEYRNSLSSRFVVGETITGQISGATGILVSKDTQLSQLVLRAVEGDFQPNELVVGSVSSDSVTTFSVFDQRLAPHHYEDQNGLTSYNAVFIDEGRSPTGVQAGTSNSELNLVTNLDYETQLNDSRANIRVIKPELVYDFSKAYRDLINSNA